ncbi:hypothetical protein EIP91_009629 [Steccherinum ochraceum]|uniref:Protein kinase domain-containing protein n=1 Tax=Steccherinum ochraceum TaxID=92696 RepID=A0A4R0R439_9APHY|nr:hypothetical protein EIP91_009629 [Steccherinum ochraceum]
MGPLSITDDRIRRRTLVVAQNARRALDEIRKVVDSGAHLVLRGVEHKVQGRLSLKIAIKRGISPTFLFLEGVQRVRSDGGDDFPMAEDLANVHFCREAFLWTHLDHQYILPFFGVSETVLSGSMCTVSPWMEHGTLLHYVNSERKHGNLKGISFQAAVDTWLHQISLGLRYLHFSGVIHGNLHLGNVLIKLDLTISLTDFGIAIRWMAPELLDHETLVESQPPTKKSDVYSFACTVIELYTLQPPFPDLTNRQIATHVLRGLRPTRPFVPESGHMGDALWSIINNCWNPKPRTRFSAKTVATKLDKIASRSTVLLSLIEDLEQATPDGDGCVCYIDVSAAPDGLGADTSLIPGEEIPPYNAPNFFLSGGRNASAVEVALLKEEREFEAAKLLLKAEEEPRRFLFRLI